MIQFNGEDENKRGFDPKSLSHGNDGNKRIAKVLIVENEAIVAEDLRASLEQMGYDVTAVTGSGRSALDFAKQNPPDILLMDLDIKGDLNGAEIAVILQGYFSEILPVVFVTAFSEKEYPVIKALDSYVFVKKPFSDEDLRKSLDHAIALKRRADL